MVEPLDPKTVTVEQMAAISRATRRAKRVAALVAAIVAAATLYWVFHGMPDAVAMYGTPITIIAAAVAYWITHAVMQP
jgi:hypothetical protein